MYVVQSGWELVGRGRAITFMSTWTRIDWDLLLHFHTHVMLRSGFVFCTCAHTSCYALGSSLALAHTRHATLWDLLLHFAHHASCTCTHTHTSCYALGSSLALAHIRHATLWDLLLHLHTHVMLRSRCSCTCTHTSCSGIFSCTCTHTSCYALGFSLALARTTSCYALGASLALAHTRHATLHLHTHVMLRYCTSSLALAQTHTHTSCYALGSSLALAHTHVMLRPWDLLLHLHTLRHATLWDLLLRFALSLRHATLWDLLLYLHTRHATLWDLLLHLHTHVMLRSGIFSCTCTHTSCYALGSSLALAHTRHATLWDLLLPLAHTRHATLWDLLLHLHTHVMLRYWARCSCTCTHTSCYATGIVALALAHTRHATLLASLLLHLHTHTHVMLPYCIVALALAHTRHATLLASLLLHLHTHVMLRSGIFSCTCARTSCYALGSSLALAHTHTRHATLWDLLLHLQYMKFPLPMSKFNVLNHSRNAMKNMFFVIPKLVSDAVIFNTEMNEWYVNNESMMICQKTNMKMLVSYYFTTICKTLDPSSTKTSCSPSSKRRAGFYGRAA